MTDPRPALAEHQLTMMIPGGTSKRTPLVPAATLEDPALAGLLTEALVLAVKRGRRAAGDAKAKGIRY
jgi:hypothetical protein